MCDQHLPYLVEAAELAPWLERPRKLSLLVVCLGNHDRYLSGHLPGAVWFDAGRLNGGIKPAPGLLPDPSRLESDFAAIGLGAEQHVVCYDDNGGTAAARMMWVLEAMGHRRLSMLDGGLEAWLADDLPLEQNGTAPAQAERAWKAHPDASVIAVKADVVAALGDPRVRILDARSEDEFLGRKTNSARKGRIPGARNLDWEITRDPDNAHRLLPAEKLETMLAERGFDRAHEIIVHCQTHQRSSHSFVMLRSLGFSNIRAYAGSWMEWAADESLPIIREETT